MSLTGSSEMTPAVDADHFPDKPIEVIVPFGAGGSTDAVGRILASVISKYLPNNQNIVIINEPGQSAVRGTQIIANAKPDGYRMGLTVSQSCAQGQYIIANTTYDYDDFEYLMKVHSMPMHIQVLSDSDIKTFQDFIDRMGGKGEPLLVGVPNKNSSAGGMGMTELGTKYKLTNYKAVPYDNNGLLAGALQQGSIDAIWCANDESFGFTCLALSDSERCKALPDVATVTELGYPLIPASCYSLLVTPKGVPENRLKILNDAFSKAMKDPDFIKAMQANQYEIDYKDSAVVKKDIESYAKQVKQFYIENNLLINDPSEK